MIIDKVTFTGADESVNPDDLAAISGEFPFVEWGILFGSREGHPRFPTMEWVGRLWASKLFKSQMQLSAHLCGKYVRWFTLGDEESLANNLPLMTMFSRIQLNFHGQQARVNNAGMINCMQRFPGKQFILQMDGVNNLLVEYLSRGNELDVTGLYDTSHGAGVVPESWPIDRYDAYRGYAGGLGPHNLEEQLAKIESIMLADRRIWIDMETHVRSDGNFRFDLDKVRQCLVIAKPYVR